MAPGPWRLGEYIRIPLSDTGYQQVAATLIIMTVGSLSWDYDIVMKFASILPRQRHMETLVIMG
jgi:hypothetical protein